MNEAEALTVAKRYATEWSVPWVRVVKTEKKRLWFFFPVELYTFWVDTGDGEAVCAVDPKFGKVYRFEYYPQSENAFLLPLWAAYPSYSSVESGWRQGSGEEYGCRWGSFYRSLSESAQAEYRQKFPPPEDEARLFQGFYEWKADAQKRGEH